MSTTQRPKVTEEKAMEVAEASRETDVKDPSFLKELFLGNFHLDLIHPFPQQRENAEFVDFFQKFKTFLRDKVDPVLIDTTGEYPPEMIDGLRELGAFGMKIPKEYGGLGFTQAEYDKVMTLLGTVCGNTTALLSAHQSIGVPQPLKLFGTPEQKKKFLPRLARGAISAFALTESDVGSDPARMATTIESDGDDYIINGEKLWCTNGTLAEIIVVMGCHPNTHRISTIIVEMDTPGVKIEHRCRFMGLKALGNAVISFKNVRVPKDNLIGKEGAGLKIALITLNTGRLALPATCIGSSKLMLEICRTWATERVQWGRPIGKHEAISQKIANMAANTFAMESISVLASRLSVRGTYDIRLEAAAAKEWNSTRNWDIIDDALQIRGGRGYETESSLAARGEIPIGVERAMRDSRINRIFEGSSEIMHLFIAREAVDKHLQVAGALVKPKATTAEKLKALPKIAAFYATWYPTRYLGWSYWPKYVEFGSLAKHLRFAERRSRKLSRAIFHGMMLYQAGLQNKQAFLGRIVDIGLELFTMTATITRAQRMVYDRHPESKWAVQLADLYCRSARRKVKLWFKELWNNDDVRKYKVAMNILKGDYEWLEKGGITLAEYKEKLKETSTNAPAEKSAPQDSTTPNAPAPGNGHDKQTRAH